MTTEHNAFPFTQSRLEAIKPPKSSRDTYRDSKTAGLTFVITVNGSKSFYYYKRIEGKPTRIRIGGFPEISIDDARREAQKFSGEIAKGENPQTTRRKKTNTVTVTELFDYWFITHGKVHKKSWQEDVRMFHKYCVPLHKKQLTQLTKPDIIKWHQKIGEKHGHYQANRAYELIRSLFRYSDEVGYQGTSPCIGVRKFPEESRERFLMPDELKLFHEAVMEEGRSPALARPPVYAVIYGATQEKCV